MGPIFKYKTARARGPVSVVFVASNSSFLQDSTSSQCCIIHLQQSKYIVHVLAPCAMESIRSTRKLRLDSPDFHRHIVLD